MTDKPFARIVMLQVRLSRLLVQYFCLRVRYVYLHIELFLLKAAGALLIEAVKIECFIKSLSKEERFAFAACIAVSIYILALIMRIRL